MTRSRRVAAKSPTVLIVSAESDQHIPFVARFLDDEPLILDWRRMIRGEGLSFAFHQGRVRVQWQEKPLGDVSGVWFRKPRSERMNLSRVAPPYRRYSKSALTGHYSM